MKRKRVRFFVGFALVVLVMFAALIVLHSRLRAAVYVGSAVSDGEPRSKGVAFPSKLERIWRSRGFTRG